MFGVVPKSIWSRSCPADENNLITLSLRSLVIDTGKRIVLVDNGIGDKQDQKFYRHLYLHGGSGIDEGLAQGGYTRDQITDVILTHLHYDHCGGSLGHDTNKNPYPIFPNATYWVSRIQWENAMNPNPREADSFLDENLLPLQELNILNLIEDEGFFLPEIELKMVHGHTPGQLIPIIHFKGRKLLYGADLFPMKPHIPVKYNMAYDLEVLKTMNEKESFLKTLVEENITILFEHDPDHECASVVQTIKGYQAGETSTLKEWLTLYPAQ